MKYQTHYIQKASNKGKKRLEILKERRKGNGGSHVIQSIERDSPFKLIYFLCNRLDE